MSGDVAGVVQPWQRVDEAEELHLERFRTHRDAHHLVVDPGGAKEQRPRTIEAGEDVAADGLRQRFDIRRCGTSHNRHREENGRCVSLASF